MAPRRRLAPPRITPSPIPRSDRQTPHPSSLLSLSQIRRRPLLPPHGLALLAKVIPSRVASPHRRRSPPRRRRFRRAGVGVGVGVGEEEGEEEEDQCPCHTHQDLAN